MISSCVNPSKCNRKRQLDLDFFTFYNFSKQTQCDCKPTPLAFSPDGERLVMHQSDSDPSCDVMELYEVGPSNVLIPRVSFFQQKLFLLTKNFLLMEWLQSPHDAIILQFTTNNLLLDTMNYDSQSLLAFKGVLKDDTIVICNQTRNILLVTVKILTMNGIMDSFHFEIEEQSTDFKIMTNPKTDQFILYFIPQVTHTRKQSAYLFHNFEGFKGLINEQELGTLLLDYQPLENQATQNQMEITHPVLPIHFSLPTTSVGSPMKKRRTRRNSGDDGSIPNIASMGL